MTRAIALLLTFLTGFSGLVYEVSWQKYLATLLGSHSEATAAVLGLYLGGLAAGYAVFGWVARRAVDRAALAGQEPPLLRIYGLAEMGIGFYALAFPLLFGAVQRISFWLPPGHEAASFGFDVFLCLLPARAAHDPDGRNDPHPDAGAHARPLGRDPHPCLHLRLQHGGCLRGLARRGLRPDPLARARRRVAGDGGREPVRGSGVPGARLAPRRARSGRRSRPRRRRPALRCCVSLRSPASRCSPASR